MQKKNNKDFREGFKEFKTCQQVINKNISDKAVDEMFIQHIFIKQIYEEVFNFKNFLSNNTIGSELQKLYRQTHKHRFFLIQGSSKTLSRFMMQSKA
ncbi:MAG: hypothetical protein R2883_00640 [Caldisericia bacterium]